MAGLRRDWDVPDPLAALRDGDPAPFEAFVRAGAPRLVGFFRRLGAGAHEAEDMSQEVFVKLWRSAGRYRPEERFGAYCFRLARNVWIDARRRGLARLQPVALDHDGARGEPAPADGRVSFSPLEALRSGAAEPGEALAASEEIARLRAAVRRLSERHRLVFELGVVQELSYAEISAVLEIPTGTVKSRMFHAVRRLREALGEGVRLAPVALSLPSSIEEDG